MFFFSSSSNTYNIKTLTIWRHLRLEPFNLKWLPLMTANWYTKTTVTSSSRLKIPFAITGHLNSLLMKTFIKIKCGRMEYKRVNQMNRTSVVKQSIKQNIIEIILFKERKWNFNKVFKIFAVQSNLSKQ